MVAESLDRLIVVPAKLMLPLEKLVRTSQVRACGTR